MGKIVYRSLLPLAAVLLATIAFAQEKTDSVKTAMSGTTGNNTTAPESFMRSEGKIYVVMAVCITILVALFLYLIRIDRKVSRLEKQS